MCEDLLAFMTIKTNFIHPKITEQITIIMSIGTLLSLLFIAHLGSVRSEEFDKYYRAADLFDVLGIDAYTLGSRYSAVREGYVGPSATDKLNDYLTKCTISSDPDENLDLVLEQFTADLRAKSAPESRSNQSKRVLLALRTLVGANKCNYYSFRVLQQNARAIQVDAKSIIENKDLTRVGKILAHYINQHVKECRRVYFRKFDEITKKFDPKANQKLNAIFESTIEIATSDKYPNNLGKSQTERFYNAATYKFTGKFFTDLEGIYSALWEVIAKDLKVTPHKNKNSGYPMIRWDVFNRIFNDYIREPCAYLRREYGPDVFEPIGFDSKYDGRVQEDRPDFYEAWLRYKLCGEPTIDPRNMYEFKVFSHLLAEHQ